MRYLLLIIICFVFVGCNSAKHMNFGTAMQACLEHCAILHPNTHIVSVTTNASLGKMEDGIIDECICKDDGGKVFTLNNVKTNKKLVVDVE